MHEDYIWQYYIMDSFYFTVLIIATVALIIVLTYIGILMSSPSESAVVFPPMASTCPDYWTVSPDDIHKCEIPSHRADNIGRIYSDDKTGLLLNPDNTKGLELSTKTINVGAVEWGQAGAAVCKKREWASQFGIVWDGISNYNGC